ncbi:unnamed protein product [Brachionus calyciflorus]|uniref:Transmembrane protein n=1 Tax=Brachionus calyciflorus TaxID=104777 RepID=A0A814EA41_9BILA|nr:unnamed protein product [Brachionus calyciflorus]
MFFPKDKPKSKQKPKSKNILQLSNIFIFSFEYGFKFLILIIDWKLMSDTTWSASIAIKEFNSKISFSAIYLLAIFLHIFFILLTIYPYILQYSTNEALEVIIFKHKAIMVAFFLAFIPKEIITFKFINSFNFYHEGYVQLRAYLTFIYIVLFILFCINEIILIVKHQDSLDFMHNTLLKLIPVFCIMLILIVCAGLNMVTLYKLETKFNKDISPKTIKLGLYTNEEIYNLTNGNYLDSFSYEQKIICSLNDVIKINKEEKIQQQGRHYVKYFRKEIDCNSSQIFYNGCKKFTKMIIKIRDRNFEYPDFRCGMVSLNGSCSNGCDDLKRENIGVYLVQYFEHKLELAWNGFARSEFKQPRVKLNESLDLSACSNLDSIYIDNSDWNIF